MANGTTSLPGDLIVPGAVNCQSINASSAFISDQQVRTASAGTPISASKIGHRVFRGHSQAGTAATQTIRLHVASAAGSVNRLALSAIVAAIGAATVTADLKKNGTTILASVVTLDSSTAATGNVLASITSPTYAANDVFDLFIVATVSTGTLPTGFLAEAAFDEAPQ